MLSPRHLQDADRRHNPGAFAGGGDDKGTPPKNSKLKKAPRRSSLNQQSPPKADDYFSTTRSGNSSDSGPSQAPVTPARTPPPERRMGSTREGIRMAPSLPVHPEFHSFLTLDATHRSKIYLSNRILMKTDGPMNRSNEWQDIWAQLMGTSFSIWWMEEIEAAKKEGRSILPTTVDITDAFVYLHRLSPQRAFEIVMPDSTVFQLSCPDEQTLTSWITAFRLSTWERSRLEEVFTASLLRTTFGENNIWIEPRSVMSKSRKEGPMRICLPGCKEFVAGWAVLTGNSDSSGSTTHSMSAESGSRPGTRRRLTSFLSRRRPPSGEDGYPSATLALYSSAKPKDRKRPILSIQHVNQAFLVYPEDPDLIFRSTLMKLEGIFGPETNVAGRYAGQEAWMAVLPESQSGQERATLQEVVEWMIAFHDAFGLYGRPRAYSWDTRDPNSLVFANSRGHDAFFLSRVLAEGVPIGEKRTAAVRTSMRRMLADRPSGRLPHTSKPIPRPPPPERAISSSSDSQGPATFGDTSSSPSQDPRPPHRPVVHAEIPVLSAQATIQSNSSVLHPSLHHKVGQHRNEALQPEHQDTKGLVSSSLPNPSSPNTKPPSSQANSIPPPLYSQGHQKSLDLVLKNNRNFIGERVMPEVVALPTPASATFQSPLTPAPSSISHTLLESYSGHLLSEPSVPNDSIPLPQRPLSRIFEASAERLALSSSQLPTAKMDSAHHKVITSSTFSYSSASPQTTEAKGPIIDVSGDQGGHSEEGPFHSQEYTALNTPILGRPTTPTAASLHEVAAASALSDASSLASQPPPVPDKSDHQPGTPSQIHTIPTNIPSSLPIPQTEPTEQPLPQYSNPSNIQISPEKVALPLLPRSTVEQTHPGIVAAREKRALPLPPIPTHVTRNDTSLPPPTPPPKPQSQLLYQPRPLPTQPFALPPPQPPPVLVPPMGNVKSSILPHPPRPDPSLQAQRRRQSMLIQPSPATLGGNGTQGMSSDSRIPLNGKDLSKPLPQVQFPTRPDNPVNNERQPAPPRRHTLSLDNSLLTHVPSTHHEEFNPYTHYQVAQSPSTAASHSPSTYSTTHHQTQGVPQHASPTQSPPRRPRLSDASSQQSSLRKSKLFNGMMKLGRGRKSSLDSTTEPTSGKWPVPPTGLPPGPRSPIHPNVRSEQAASTPALLLGSGGSGFASPTTPSRRLRKTPPHSPSISLELPVFGQPLGELMAEGTPWFSQESVSPSLPSKA